MRTKRYVYEVANDYILGIANEEEVEKATEKVNKYIRACEQGLISPLEVISVIVSGKLFIEY